MYVSECMGLRVGQVFKHKTPFGDRFRFVRIANIYLYYQDERDPWFCMEEYSFGKWYRSMIGVYSFDEINRWTDLFAENTEEFERKFNSKDDES